MDFEQLDKNIDMMMACLELEGATCGLKHSKEDPSENHPAINYLCQGLGNQDTGEKQQEIRVPICEECAEALRDRDWILVYCTYCNKSQWIYRPLAKNGYPPGNLVYWLDVCPFCAEVVNEYEEK
jgi:hypothetical protein